MAVEREFVHWWVAEHGPWALHICQTEGARERVLAEGLRTAGDGTPSRSVAELAARPGHVYLCVGVGVRLVVAQSFRPDPDHLAARAVAVDLRGLDPARISPDEDCCYESTLTLERGLDALPAPGARPAALTVRDPFGLEVADESARQFAARPYASYGDWAHHEQVGSDPAHTAACWQAFGSLAHRGAISPKLLCPALPGELRALLAPGDQPFAAAGVGVSGCS